ncbi:glycosyltransferase family 2 protein [Candidatus Pelagibacter sp. HIMB1611]|uniref:glycosyltransferase family 2 protein n=1 Tax=unclassified Candidatus Pelagibacter TaxID=2647897 RepID=UPI003F8257E7
MKLISFVIPVFNEEDNIESISKKIVEIFSANFNYDYEFIIIDNNSVDNTEKVLRNMCEQDKKIKVILNRSNFGWSRSLFHALKQCNSDATIVIAADFQDPPELIVEMIKNWEKGEMLVLGEKEGSDEKFIMNYMRKIYYKFINKFSDQKVEENVIGFGLYDQSLINLLKKIYDPNPFLRGIVKELGYKIKKIKYHQPKRKMGLTKFSFMDLIDVALSGVVRHSKLSIRIFTLFGFFMSFLSIIIGIYYLLRKIFFWNTFEAGVAPLVVGFFLISSFLIFFMGLISEYILTILDFQKKIPNVIEKDRINFDK